MGAVEAFMEGLVPLRLQRSLSLAARQPSTALERGVFGSFCSGPSSAANASASKAASSAAQRSSVATLGNTGVACLDALQPSAQTLEIGLGLLDLRERDQQPAVRRVGHRLSV